MRASFLGNLIIRNERLMPQKITVLRGATKKIAALTGHCSTRMSNTAPLDCLPFNMTPNFKRQSHSALPFIFIKNILIALIGYGRFTHFCSHVFFLAKR